MATERPVRLVLDASLIFDLFGGDGTGEVAPALRPGAEALLWRLRYSNLCVAICHPEEMPTDVIPEYTSNGSVYRELVTGYDKPHITSDLMAIFIQRFDFLEKTANLHSFQYILLPAPSGDQLTDESMLEWSRSSSCFYATSRVDEDLFSELRSHNWRVIVVDNEHATKDSGVVNISKLQELLLTLAILIKKEIDSSSVLMVGYAMKQSREQDFGKRGAFPLYPSKNGLIFVPLSFELPLASQLHEVDIILHKMTDEIIQIDPNCSINFPKGVTFSAGMSEIIRFMEEYPDLCIIDPFKNISPLLDRLQIQEILVRLQEVGTEGRPKLRAPHSLKVKDFHGSELQKQLAEANLSFPFIVKPQVACGVADAHNMALVFQIEEFSNLSVPLPAILQEYIDHGSKIFKFYVIGDKVFHAVKNSMPNASLLKSSSGDEPLTFNSLKTLPVATKEQLLQNRVQDNKSLNIDVVEEAAKMLKESLGLTIFGFDVVVQEGSGDHVIVDLNYLPSFKEVPDSEAMPAFWDAIRKSYESKKGKMKT